MGNDFERELGERIRSDWNRFVNGQMDADEAARYRELLRDNQELLDEGTRRLIGDRRLLDEPTDAAPPPTATGEPRYDFMDPNPARTPTPFSGTGGLDDLGKAMADLDTASEVPGAQAFPVPSDFGPGPSEPMIDGGQGTSAFPIPGAVIGGAVGVVAIAGVVAGLALGHAGPFAGAAGKPAGVSVAKSSEAPPQDLSMTAFLSPPETIFTVTARDSDGDPLTFKWTGGIGCGTFKPPITPQSQDRTTAPRESRADWFHENAPPPPPDLSKSDADGDGIPDYCPHSDTPNFSHPGKITVVISDGRGGEAYCTYSGSLSGTGACQPGKP